ncbi:extracellular solute-binding protein [Kiloniella laminariae]|uniref:Extracellular solute-binding protein n=1 Tax=Kiloniella laminariae TaxID=454162 RepID=A0ABT4LKT0_9PROT|nr:substrate-binding domain-containing protein [Kiloniella laminariae]MCZ4280572.1 extracellular solute-binding protein [Kiloniella laminariae]
MKINRFFAYLLATLLVLNTNIAFAADRYIVVASTTSTENSGLFSYILPIFTEKSGIEVRVVAKGTGKAIRMAQDGDADVLFVHHKPSEEKFVTEGYGLQRFDVMYNDFILVGPDSDPAGVAGNSDITAAFKQIADKEALFASRGDDSGTHKKEQGLWKKAGVDYEAASGKWYRATGQGMGATLNAAVAMGAYALSDRATWIAFKNKGDFSIVSEGSPLLFNQYGVILVNPEKHPHVKAEEGQAFIDWVLSKEGQDAIASFKLEGEQLFFTNAQ